MLILDAQHQPIGRVTSFLWRNVEQERMTTIVRLFGRLIAYLPHTQRAYYAWALTLTYRPTQHLSVHQLSPAHLRVTLFSRWEVGLILGYWLLGLRLGQPLVWLRRLQTA
jgi:hypothetical protein